MIQIRYTNESIKYCIVSHLKIAFELICNDLPDKGQRTFFDFFTDEVNEQRAFPEDCFVIKYFENTFSVQLCLDIFPRRHCVCHSLTQSERIKKNTH